MRRFALLLSPLCAALACNGSSVGTSASSTSGGLATTGGPSSASSASSAGAGQGPSASATGGSTTGSSTINGSSTGGATNSGSSTGTTTGGAPAVGCTSDLRSTTDANGHIVATCGPNEGCQGGVCVDACTAAATAKGSIGCDFYAPDTPFYGNGQGSSFDGPCYATLVSNPWVQAAHLSVDFPGRSASISAVAYIPSGIAPNVKYTPVDADGGLAPSQTAILFLSASPTSTSGTGSSLACPQTDTNGNPIVPLVAADAAVQGSGAGTAFHLASDTPVQVQDILPYGGPSTFLAGGSLVFPSSAWGANYFVASPGPGTLSGQNWLVVVGLADNTTLTVNSPTTLPGGGTVSGCVGGTPTTLTINRGQMLQWINADPSGAIIAATQPVGVFSGNTDLGVNNDHLSAGGGDGAHQQIPPISALGNNYVAPGYTTREQSGQQENIPYTLVGVTDGTVLSYDPGPPSGAPPRLDAGLLVQFASSSTFAVRSQDAAHPFLLTQYMPGTWSTVVGDGSSTVSGCNLEPDIGCGLGDEEWVVIPPTAQFLQRYVFATEPTYATTNVTLTRQNTDAGFQSVNLGCLGGAVPEASWLPVGDGGSYQVAYIDLYRGGVAVGACGESQQEADSTAPFGVMVWGTDTFVSYAYSAGGGVAPLNDVVVTP